MSGRDGGDSLCSGSPKSTLSDRANTYGDEESKVKNVGDDDFDSIPLNYHTNQKEYILFLVS